MFDFNMLSALGCKFDASFNRIVVTNSRLLPKITFVRSSELIRISYPGPQGFGLQSFEFEPNSFFLAYNKIKSIKHDYDDNDDFVDAGCSFGFGSDCLPVAGTAGTLSSLILNSIGDKRAFPKFILDFFNISPTLIRKLLHQRDYSKIALKPNQIAILSAIGQGWNRHNPNSQKKLSEQDIINRNKIISSMNNVVAKAAAQHSYQFVFQYIELYKQLLSIDRGYSVNFIPNSKRDKLENEFIKKVNALQKESDSCEDFKKN